MFNKSGVTKQSYGNTTQILGNVEFQYSVGIVVSDAGTDADASGKKIVKAGQPLAGDLTARTTAFTKAAADGTDVKGVLLHDVDVTAGAANGTLLLFGVVNTNRLETAIKDLYTSGMRAALGDLPMGIHALPL